MKVGEGAFNAANGYSFSGTTQIGSADTVTLVVRADASWVSGARAGDTRQVTVTAPTDCEKPLATIADTGDGSPPTPWRPARRRS